MSNTLKVIGSLVVILFISFGLFQVGDKTQTSLSGVTVGNEYHSTTTSSTWTVGRMVESCTNSLGSVIITKATAGSNLELRDATSTTDIASTSIVTISSTATSGAYPFDVALLRNGLAVLVTSGNVSSTTITCR